jgi:DNA/RNA endonuclease G (NUC1)
MPQSSARSRFVPLIALALLGVVVMVQQVFFARRVQAASTSIVISQIYGAGGNSGATLQNDYIELFNKGNSAVNLSGWSVQYTSATGTGNFSGNVTALSGTLAAGQYYLVKESGGANGAPLPAADATGTISMAAGAGKVIVANTTTGLACNGSSTPCNASQLAQIVDLIGYGTGSGGANFFEGSTAAPSIGATTADFRDDLGCTDTDQNGADFASAVAPVSPGPPAPRNTASALHPCTTNQAIVPSCPGTLTTQQGTAASANVSATDPDGTVTSAAIISAPVSGITLTGFTAASGVGGTATATLNVANTTAAGSYNVVIRYSNNDPSPQTADCTVVVTVTAPNQPIAPSCPASLNVNHGSAGSTNVSATDPDGTVASASITSAPVAGITLDSFTPAGGVGGTATATLNVASTTAVGTYNVTIQYANNDSPTPQTASCTVVVNVNVPPDSVVISQVYGGGGNTGSTLKNDYIELINHSSVPVNLNGWSVQAWAFNTNSWQVTPLTNVTLQPGQYYLVQESQGAGGTDNLPTPDAIGTIPISSGSTKVALLSNTTAITAACPNAGSGLVDLVSYGSDPIIGTCYEGSGAAPAVSNTIVVQRRNEGCFDTDDNAADFITAAPNPHNTSSPTHDCTGLSAYGSANPSTVVQGDSTTLTVHVAAAQNPSSTAVTVTADLSSIGGSASQAFGGSGSVFTYVATVPANNPPGMKSLPVTVADGQTRTANTNILLSILPIIPDHVTISQVYGGGGNTGATYSNDYVELYNPTAATISMSGWSIQYGPATGTTFTGKTVIGGTIAPGAHYLISLASGGAVGAPLPQASVNGDINMAAGAGKIVLVSNTQTLLGACPIGTDPDIVDFVGYGTTANCHEGNANAPAPSNTTAIFRKNSGGTDTDQNGNDFIVGAPNPRSESPIVEFGPSVVNTDPATNSTTAPYDLTVTVDFSEPVTVDSGWYNLTCTNTGAHNIATEAHTNDLKTYAFTPNTTFQFGEQCTVTIPKTAVHDVDTDDSDPDTDTLAADYVWSFTVVGAGQPAPYPPSVHLTMGNPSGADAFQPLNYLMEKPTYSVSYNRDKGTPNWVSWHLDSSWYGTLARVDTFRPDPKVDPSWYRVQAFDYSGSGFDRGHMTPNADRDNQNRVPINQETYLMSNMVPQSPDNNQGPWALFEAYLRTQADAGNEIYIVSGPNGVGGIGSASGNTINTIANGKVTVPSSTWKVALVMPAASGDDVARVTCSTRTIAIQIPNIQGIRSNPWETYLTTVDAVEQLTGYDFFSNLPPAVQACIEAGTNGTNPPGTADQSATTAEDNSVTITLQALQANSDPLTFSIMSNPSSGSLGSVSAATCSSGTCTATVTYTPFADTNGPDSFTFRANDGSVHSNTSTVTVGVSEVNDSPTASDDSKTAQEDTPLSFPASDLTANDSAGPANETSQALTVTSVTPGANTHGTLNLASGTVTYTPAANYNGLASFSYTMCDDGTTNGSPDPKCASATVNVDVQSVNDNPTAVDDSSITDEDTPVTINVLANDSDVDGDSLTVSAVTQGAHGSVTNNGSNVTYSPAANFNGSDSFTYTVSDGHGGTATANVSVTINAVNDAPVANPDSATTDEDTPATINVLANDSDVDGDSLVVSAVTQGAHGSVTNNGNNVTYSPAANFNGSDSFSYTVSDGHGGTATANVSVTINAVNDNPVANNDSATTDEDTPVTINVLSNDSDVDGDSLTVSAVTQGAHGLVTNNGNNVTYSPAANFNGNDSFSYTVSDGHGGTATANVSVTINPVNDNPVAVNDSATTNEDTSVTIDVVANDTDVDGDTLSLSSVGSAAHGSVAIVSGKAVYSPATNYNGNDSFGYVVSDGHGGHANGSVSVTINAVNDPPTANSQSVNTTSNTPVAITLTGSDVETPSGSMVFTVTSGPSHGSLSGSGANRIYMPALNYSGPDSFKFTVTDTGDGASPPLTSSEATVSITVNDTLPPVITLNGSKISLWPPNHAYHTVTVSDLVASASDNFDPNVSLDSVVIAQASSDEAEDGTGDGNTLNDIIIASDCKSVQLRAERESGADGRVYTLTFLARDAAGNISTVTAHVMVPKNEGDAAIDSGPHYTVTSICH